MHSSQRQSQQKNVTASGPPQAPHWRADARRAWAPRRTARRTRSAEGRERACPNTEAGEAGQVRVNFHESLDQQGSQAGERARPPVLLRL